jgi:anaerobic selenocysteine-containing dehydrogenase
MIAEARLSEEVRKDVIAISHGTWIKHNGGVNQLTECRMSTMGGMAGFHSTTVEIAPAP